MDKIQEKTQKHDCVLPILVKPVFIEDSFIAPLFNDAMEQELRIASEWIIHEKIDEFCKKLTLDIIDELIEFNKKLLGKYNFDDKKATRGIGVPIVPDEFEKVNPRIRTCRFEFIAKNEYLTDFWNFQINVYAMISRLTGYRYNCFENCNEVEAKYYDLIIQLFKDLYEDCKVYYSVILNKYES
ncbi:MAG: hypothetical protein Q4G33_14785 [bacterium]|nr:hypothetical protein [bacterium]